SMLISTVFSVGLLAKRNELTAMKATGISLYRIALPITIIGLIVSFISFELDNTWVSKGNEVRYNIEREYMKRRSRVKAQTDLQNVFLQKNEKTHISIERYKVRTTI
ncbi:MAG: LptF/LptG family permease, partial [Candidatus Marinimicrobia bacterium]|nr:LptF/LptG family permease [Candidatus Neomarinimicrobiota bacterium]